MSFTEGEKMRIRLHTGYLNVSAVSTFLLGVPASVQTQYLIEPAMDKVLIEAEDRVRMYLNWLDQLEFQVFDDADTLVASKVGSIDLRQDEFENLMKRYLWFADAVCNILGVIRNPFDKRFNDPSGGVGINVPVSHC